jgi:hypothetical protein
VPSLIDGGADNKPLKVKSAVKRSQTDFLTTVKNKDISDLPRYFNKLIIAYHQYLFNHIIGKPPVPFRTGRLIEELFAEINCRKQTKEAFEERDDSAEESTVHLSCINLMGRSVINPATGIDNVSGNTVSHVILSNAPNL